MTLVAAMIKTDTTRAAAATLSMFDAYDGYVLTQGRRTLARVVAWERSMRALAMLILGGLAVLWIKSDAQNSADVVLIKLVLSAVLVGLATRLLWVTRAQPHYEARIDLIHGRLRQVVRTAAGREQILLTVPFDKIDSLFIRHNRGTCETSCLYLRLREVDGEILVGIGSAEALEPMHRRISQDMIRARGFALRKQCGAASVSAVPEPDSGAMGELLGA